MPDIKDINDLVKLFGGTTALLMVACYFLYKFVMELYHNNQKLSGDMMESARVRSEREAITNSSLEEMRKEMHSEHTILLEAVRGISRERS